MSPIRTASASTPVSVPAERGRDHDRMRRLRRRLGWHRRWWAAGLAAAAVFTAVQALRPPSPETVQVLVAARDLPAGRPLEAEDLERVAYTADTVPDGALAAEQPPTGRTLAAPVRAGTPLTDRSLVGRPLLRSLPAGTVAAPTRIADPELLRLIQVGDLVDVVAGGGMDSAAMLMADPGHGVAGPVPGGTAAPDTDPATDPEAGSETDTESDTEPDSTTDSAPDSTSGWAAYAHARVVARDARVLAIPGAGSADGPGNVTASGNGGLVLLAVPARTALELAGIGSPLSLVLHGTRS